MRPVLPALLPLSLAGCLVFPWSDGEPTRRWEDRPDTGAVPTDPGWGGGPVEIHAVDVYCSGTGDGTLWYLTLLLTGWPAVATVELAPSAEAGPPPATETHELLQIGSTGDGGEWVASVGGAATALDCSWQAGFGEPDGRLATKFSVWGEDGDLLACAIAGTRSAAQFADDACGCYDLDADCTD